MRRRSRTFAFGSGVSSQGNRLVRDRLREGERQNGPETGIFHGNQIRDEGRLFVIRLKRVKARGDNGIEADYNHLAVFSSAHFKYRIRSAR